LHCRVDTTDDDAIIASYIVAARVWAENFTNRGLVTQTWRMKLRDFPKDRDWIEIPRAPLVSVSSVSYVDAAGATQTWGAGNYVVSADAEPGRLSLGYGKDWPSVRDQADAVTLTFVVGYGGQAAVPEPIKAAIRLQVGDLYANREASVVGDGLMANPAAKALLHPYRMLAL